VRRSPRRLVPSLRARGVDTEVAQGRRDRGARSPIRRCRKSTSTNSTQPAGPAQNKMFFTVEQEFPLWGKGGEGPCDAIRPARRCSPDPRCTRLTEAEALEKVKVAFAPILPGRRAIRTTEDLHRGRA